MKLEVQNLKQGNSRFKLTSVLCAVLGFLSLCFVVYVWIDPDAPTLHLGFGTSIIGMILLITAIISGAICCFKGIKYRQLNQFVIFVVFISMVGIGILCVYCYQYPVLYQKEHCFVGLRNLSEALHDYARESNNYPPIDTWCDVLIKYAENHPDSYSSYFNRSFTCQKWIEGRSSYAMNPNVKPNSPDDVVWLFDSIEGWNLYGGSELLNWNNHEGKGCNVLFSNGQIMFVEKEKLASLRWK